MENNYSTIPNYSNDTYYYGQEDYSYTGNSGTFNPSYQPQQLYNPYPQPVQHNYTPDLQIYDTENTSNMNNGNFFFPDYESSGNPEYSSPSNYENYHESMSSQDLYSPLSDRSTDSSNYSFEMSPGSSTEIKKFEFKKESKG